MEMPSRKSDNPLSTRERILETVGDLFYRRGINTMGVDTISAESRVGKMTLYRHFCGKDDLVAAYLKRRDEWWRSEFTRRVLAGEQDPECRIDALFQVLTEWFDEEDYSGCAFINAEAEGISFPEEDPISAHKQWVQRLLRSIVADLPVDNPEELSEELFVLMEGAMVVGRRQRSAAARVAQRAARRLLDAAR